MKDTVGLDPRGPLARARTFILEGLLLSEGATAETMTREAADAWLNRWCDVFAPEVHRSTGFRVHRGIRWHAFSHDFSPHDSGDEALRLYRARPATDLVIVDEHARTGLCFTAPDPIDFTSCRPDLYVFPRTELWTMVFTHEQASGLGPCFRAHRSPDTSTKKRN
jgi:hypothetical protein